MKKQLKSIMRPFIPQPIKNWRHEQWLKKKEEILEKHKDLEKSCVSLSQAGQDFWVSKEAFNEMRDGYFVDVGAHDGVWFSNTYLMEVQYNWRGICIEGNPESYKKLRNTRSCECINLCVDNKEGVVEFAQRNMLGGIVADDCDNRESGEDVLTLPTKRLDNILRECNAPEVIDYLSIDIEGAEDRALLDFPLDDFTFKTITIERPSSELRKKFANHGYILVKELPGLDCFYIHESFTECYMENTQNYWYKRFISKRINLSDNPV